MEQHTRATGSKHIEHADRGSAMGDSLVLATEQYYSFRDPCKFNPWCDILFLYRTTEKLYVYNSDDVYLPFLFPFS